jgi:type VI secretion system protein ImpA
MSLGLLTPALGIRSNTAPDLLSIPIPGPSAVGRDVRYTGDYDAIIEARRHDNAALPQGVWQRDLKRADWTGVERLCIETLTERTKDLQVASWLTEAWINLRGFAGLEAGLGLLCRLCDRYWPDLYPSIEDGDLSARLAPLEWMNAKLPELLRSLPIVNSGSDPEERFSWTDYVNAQRLEPVRQRDPASAERAEAAGAVTLARFGTCRQRTATETIKGSVAALRDALGALDAVNSILQQQCGKEAPGLGGIRSATEEILAFLMAELADRQKSNPLATMLRRRPSVPPEASPPRPITEPEVSAPLPRTREEAYRQLSEIADFLMHAEPHSPTPYLIRRAAEWGEMALPELVHQLSQSGGDIVRLLDALGFASTAAEIEQDSGNN